MDFDEVLDFAAKAAALEPTLTSALTARGLALLATGNPLNAEDAFRSALAAGPMMPKRTVSMDVRVGSGGGQRKRRGCSAVQPTWTRAKSHC